ncbi:MAG: FAD-binding protein, partial [Polyangiaceae bacterium]
MWAESADEAAAVVTECDARGEAVLVLGGGSNLVVADAGFDGTALRCAFAAVRVTATTERDAGKIHAIVDAGASWDALVARAVGEGWSGVEALSGIPGSVGATPMQNVGAYGQEVADTIVRVRGLRRHQRVREERPRRAPLGVVRVPHHALRAAQRDHRLAHPRQRRIGAAQRLLQLAVAHRRPAPLAQREGHRQHHVAPPRRALEHAVAVTELALHGAERALGAIAAVPHAHARDDLGDLLTVRADVLHR